MDMDVQVTDDEGHVSTIVPNPDASATFIADIRKKRDSADPVAWRDVRVFTGYLDTDPAPRPTKQGQDQEGRVRQLFYLRLYASLDLHQYLDVLETDILYSQVTHSGLATSTLWVRGDAELFLTSEVVARNFLHGDILTSFGTSASAGGNGGWGQPWGPPPSIFRPC